MTLPFKLKRFLKRDDKKTNLYHPDFTDKIESAFEACGKQYYRFSKEHSLPWGRYMYLQTFLSEQNLRIDLPLLKKYMDNLTKILNGNKNREIELGKAFQIITQIQSRIELAFEVETTYKLAAILFFDDTENLYSYDKAHNDKKIAAWKEAKCLDFFYTMPMKEFLGLSDLSPDALLTFMEPQKEILEGSIYEMPEQ